jgi:hypothetical protein
MDSANNLSQSILQSSEDSMPSMETYSTTSTDTGFFDILKNINTTTWVLIILILAFLGFNIFVYLAKGTQTITDFLAPLITYIFGTTVAVTGQAVDISAEGAKVVVGETAGAIQGALTAVQNITPGGSHATSSIKGQPVNQQQHNNYDQSTLNKALNTSQSQEEDYQAYEASSSVHSAGKSGWCFIGEDRGFRTCAQVGVNDQCMSGDIFPSQDICMNPNLRP